MQLNLVGQTVMVAAASKGMGYAIALQCAREGANVSIASRDHEAITQAAEKIKDETGAQVLATTFDALDGLSISNWVRKTQDVFGDQIRGLVVNAGGPPAGQFESFSDDDWQAAFELTLLSAVRLIRDVIPAMKACGGSVVTITSSSVKEPIDILLLSNVMRSGVTALVKSLSQEYAAQNIRFNNLLPGLIDTDRVRTLNESRAEKYEMSVEQVRAEQEAELPMHRYGKPEEFANAATFLLSDAASYITGVTLAVDGGKIKTVW